MSSPSKIQRSAKPEDPDSARSTPGADARVAWAGPGEVALAELLGVEGTQLRVRPSGSESDLRCTATGDPSTWERGCLVVVAPLDVPGIDGVVLGRLANPTSLPAPRRIELVAEEELVLRCGDSAVLRLLGDGSVTLRGTDVTSRASSTQRIRGADVQIN